MKILARLCSGTVVALIGMLGVISAQGGSATWSASPLSNNWNTAANWNPATVPNGQADVATLGATNQSALEITSSISLGGVTYTTAAPAYTVSLDPGLSLQIYGAGMTNGSISVQTFVANDSTIAFHNSSSAANVAITLNASAPGSASLTFDAGASPSSVVVTANGGVCTFAGSALGHATVNLRGGTNANPTGGYGDLDGADAGYAKVGVSAATVASAAGGFVFLHNGASASNGTFTADGSFFPGQASAGLVEVDSSVDPGSALFVGNGSVNGAAGGMIKFDGVPQGTGGSVLLTNNGIFDMSYAPTKQSLSLAALNGEGNVFLGGNTLVVGTGNFAFYFGGVIQDGGIGGGSGGKIIKTGRGKWTLSGPNTYTGSTTVQGGVLLVSNTSGSATGSGPVTVVSGRLAGSGIISGPVTIATGRAAYLQPSYGSVTQVTLTVQSTLTVQKGGRYLAHLNPSIPEVVAAGVTIQSGSQLQLPNLKKPLPVGQVYTLISNTAATPIAGTFDNVPDGSVITNGPNTLKVSYEGGDGNDLTLTVQ